MLRASDDKMIYFLPNVKVTSKGTSVSSSMQTFVVVSIISFGATDAINSVTKIPILLIAKLS